MEVLGEEKNVDGIVANIDGATNVTIEDVKQM